MDTPSWQSVTGFVIFAGSWAIGNNKPLEWDVVFPVSGALIGMGLIAQNQFARSIDKMMERDIFAPTPARPQEQPEPEQHPKFKLMDDANRLKMDITSDTPAPVFIIASRGKTGATSLSMLMAKAPVFLHKESAYQNFSVSTSHRPPIGYAGGFKMTIDHISNATTMGLDHYVRYLEILRDYNLPYLGNKYMAAESKVIQNLSLHNTGPMTINLDKDPAIKAKAREVIISDDIMMRLAKDHAKGDNVHSSRAKTATAILRPITSSAAGSRRRSR